MRSSKARKEAVAEAKKDDTNKSLAVEANNQRGNAVQKLLMKAEGGKGEGSRGGHVISHTKSGAPVYASSHESYTVGKGKSASTLAAAQSSARKGVTAVMRSHKHYSEQDHDDAAAAHLNHAYALETEASRIAPPVTSRQYMPHEKAAQRHVQELVSQAKDHRTIASAHYGASVRHSTNRMLSGGETKKSMAKSLDVLHPSDGLHQMGAQFAQKHPKMSASDHMSESSKYAKAGQPHMAIGHLMASSYKSAVAKKSMACNVLKSYLKKSSFSSPKTPNGHGIAHQNDTQYSAATFRTHGYNSKVKSSALKTHVLNKFPHYGAADHESAAEHHREGSRLAGSVAGHKQHNIALAHGMAADHIRGHETIAKFPHYTAAQHTAAFKQHTGSGDFFAARGHRAAAEHMSAKPVKKSLNKEPKDLLTDFLSKAEGKGEGSRGGKIIGHTKSGHPIYAPSAGVHEGLVNTAKMDTDKKSKMQTLNAMVTHQRHRHYTAQDHQDAANAHKGHMESKASLSLRQKHGSLADAHATVAAAMKAGHLESPKIKKSLSKPQTEFDALLKASGITMWAQKADRAASLVVN